MRPSHTADTQQTKCLICTSSQVRASAQGTCCRIQYAMDRELEGTSSHIVRGPNYAVCLIGHCAEEAAKAQVAELCDPVCSDENVCNGHNLATRDDRHGVSLLAGLISRCITDFECINESPLVTCTKYLKVDELKHNLSHWLFPHTSKRFVRGVIDDSS